MKSFLSVVGAMFLSLVFGWVGAFVHCHYCCVDCGITHSCSCGCANHCKCEKKCGHQKCVDGCDCPCNKGCCHKK